jgi:alpha-1,2-mannosyltransferase
MSGAPSTHPLGQPSAARAVWLVLGPLICAVMCLPLAARLRPNQHKLHDFVQEWTSARNWLEGEPIYDELSRSVANYIRPELVVTLPIRYNAHPPASVLLTLPFGVLPYFQAVVVWNLLSLAALGASLALILGRGGLAFPRWAWWPVVSLLLLSSPLAHQIILAQLNLVLLLLFAVAWRLDRAGHYAGCGAVIGLAAAIKIFPGFLFLYCLAQRRITALMSGAATLAILNGLALAVLGKPAWVSYVTVVMPDVTRFRAAWVNASITGYWSKLFDSPNTAVMPVLTAPLLAKCLIALSSIALVAVFLGSARRAANQPQRDCAFAAGVIVALLLSPIFWHHYFVILALPLLVLWRWLPRTWPVRSLLAAAVVILLVNPWWIAGIEDTTNVAAPLKTLTVLSFQFYTLLALWVAAILGSRHATPLSSCVSIHSTTSTGQALINDGRPIHDVAAEGVRT